MAKAVEAAFAAWPLETRRCLLRVRQMIFEVAQTTPSVGPLTETLKWGEPAYLTASSKSGSTIRLGASKSATPTAMVLFNCRTTLVESFRAHFPDSFTYQGNRAIQLPVSASFSEEALKLCLGMALTYHRRQGQL